MPIVNPNGGQKYSFEGQPFEGLLLQSGDGQKYGFEGKPYEFIFPAAAAEKRPNNILQVQRSEFFLLAQ